MYPGQDGVGMMLRGPRALPIEPGVRDYHGAEGATQWTAARRACLERRFHPGAEPRLAQQA